MKVALVHDWITNLGGAERMLLELHKAFPDSPIYTSVYNPERVPEFNGIDVRTSFLQKIPLARTKHQLFPMLRRIAFERFNFDEYDVVISISGAEAKGIKTSDKTVHINICNSPTHYYWSHYIEYLKNPGMGKLDPLARFVLQATIERSRKWDFKAAQRPDHIIAISNAIKKRIKNYYKRDSTVIFPPTDTAYFATGKRVKNRSGYIVVGRQVPYKRIDLPVKVCTKTNRKLVVVGGGPENQKLKDMAGPTVKFYDQPPDKKKLDLLTAASCFIFPNEDDFGLVPVEAMAAGTPVVAYKAGGALDTVDEGVSGIYFTNQTEKNLEKALDKFESMNFDEKKVVAQAKKFDADVFRKEVKKFVKDKV